MSDNQEYFKINRGSEKNFGTTFSIIFFLISSYLFYITNHFWSVFFSLSIILTLITIFKPKLFFLPNILWFKLGMLLGRLIAPLIMLFIFFLVMFPLGLLLKVFNKDNYKKNKEVNSFWIKRDKEINTMKDQF